jgi:uncharacterized protein YndB with AHSA1/START domain
VKGEPIVVRRTLNVARARVFAAWTRPEIMAQWFRPVDTWTVRVEADLRVGGRYRLEMRDESGGIHEQFGEYRLIEPVSQLAFTWSCPDLRVSDSLVTIRLESIGEATEFELTHSDLPPDAAVRQAHEDGWIGCLGQFERFLSIHGDASMPHSHRETVRARSTPQAAYTALTSEAGYRAWWAKNCDVDEKVGGEATLRFEHGPVPVVMVWHIDAQDPSRHIHWTCTSHASPAWVGTTLDWTIAAKDGGVEIAFVHDGWREPVPEQVQQGWKHFVGTSLKAYLEEGTGQPW